MPETVASNKSCTSRCATATIHTYPMKAAKRTSEFYTQGIYQPFLSQSSSTLSFLKICPAWYCGPPQRNFLSRYPVPSTWLKTMIKRVKYSYNTLTKNGGREQKAEQILLSIIRHQSLAARYTNFDVFIWFMVNVTKLSRSFRKHWWLLPVLVHKMEFAHTLLSVICRTTSQSKVISYGDCWNYPAVEFQKLKDIFFPRDTRNPLIKVYGLTYNLLWNWNYDAIKLFHRIDSRLFREVNNNPVRFLYSSPKKLEEVLLKR